MTKKVLLLLANGFEEYEAAVFTDVMGWSRAEGDIPVDLVTAALRPKIKGTWNLTVIPEMPASEINVEDFDALAIPGGFEEAGFYEDAYHEDFLNIIRAFEAKKKEIAAICVAALPVGKSGVLEGRKGTTYHLLDSKRPDQLSAFGVNVSRENLVVDDNIITSCGPSSALDVAFSLLEKLTNRENRQKVQHAMGFTAE